MKQRFLTLSALCFTLLAFSAVSASSQTVITFDDLSENGTGTFVPNGYQWLVWNNFWCFNAILATNRDMGVTGYYYGMVSASNVVYNSGGGAAEIDSPSTNFNFLSAYLTGAWNSNVNIEVQGFRGGNLRYDQVFVAAATNPTLFAFNYLNIDRLHFSASGGQPAFGVSGGEYWFVMDNMSIKFVPEPSTVLLTALGALTLCALLKRKRT